MICQHLTSLLGFDCSPLTEGGDVVLIASPFTFDDGDALPIFAEQKNGQIRFFDDGQALMHFIGRGVRIENKKHAKFLFVSAAKYGTTFTENGELEIWAPIEGAANAFAKYLGSLIALTTWEREQKGVNTDLSIFLDEVTMALRAWKPNSEITEEPTFEGISGREYKLDLLFDGEPVVVTGASSRSVSAVLHRLVDIHAMLTNSDRKFLVVIDDRSDPESADREAKIMQTVATVMPFTALTAKSQASARIH